MDKRIENYINRCDLPAAIKGKEYYLGGKVKLYESTESTTKAKVTGTQEYEVFVDLQKQARSKFATCNCPAWANYGFCKHTIATVIAFSKYLDSITYKFKDEERSVVLQELADFNTYIINHISDKNKIRGEILAKLPQIANKLNMPLISFFFCMTEVISSFSTQENNYILFTTIFDTISLVENKKKFLELALNNEDLKEILETFFTSSYAFTTAVSSFFQDNPNLSEYQFLDGNGLVEISQKKRIGDDEEFFTYVGRKCNIDQIILIIKKCAYDEWRFFYSARYTFYEGLVYEEILKREDKELQKQYLLFLTDIGHLTRDLFVDLYPLLKKEEINALIEYKDKYSSSIPEFKILVSPSLTAATFASFEPEVMTTFKDVILEKISKEALNTGFIKAIDKATKNINSYVDREAFSKVILEYENHIHLRSILSYNNFLRTLCSCEQYRFELICLASRHGLLDILGFVPYGGENYAI